MLACTQPLSQSLDWWRAYLPCVCVCVCVCARACVCVSEWVRERERASERERERERERECVFVCVCVRERARERKREIESVCACFEHAQWWADARAVECHEPHLCVCERKRVCVLCMRSDGQTLEQLNATNHIYVCVRQRVCYFVFLTQTLTDLRPDAWSSLSHTHRCGSWLRRESVILFFWPRR